MHGRLERHSAVPASSNKRIRSGIIGLSSRKSVSTTTSPVKHLVHANYLDDKAQELLGEGRETFRQLKLERQSLVPENRDVHIFLWRGSQATAVFSAALAMAGSNPA
jgi:hypothetical protein